MNRNRALQALLPALFLLLSVTAVRAEDAPACKLCTKEIQGSYTRASRAGTTYHFCAECMKDAGRCGRCKMPVQKGEAFCEDCQGKMPECSGCGTTITGRHALYQNGERYCPTCNQGARCATCKRPLGQGGHTVGGARLCDRCEADALVCGACGKLVRGTYYRHSFVDGVFCKTCEDGLPHCSICSRPIPKDTGSTISGTRPVCGGCMKTVILDMDVIRALYAEVVKEADELLSESIRRTPKLLMVPDIAAVRENVGYTEASGSELGLFKRKGNATSIYVLYGITKALAVETLAHEWAHAWFDENGHAQHPQWVQEGFCQWVASKVLAKRGYKRSLAVLEAREDLYGKGFRYVRDLERGTGLAGVFVYMKDEPPAEAPKRP